MSSAGLHTASARALLQFEDVATTTADQPEPANSDASWCQITYEPATPNLGTTLAMAGRCQKNLLSVILLVNPEFQQSGTTMLRQNNSTNGITGQPEPNRLLRQNNPRMVPTVNQNLLT